jgi:hypothetical protein
MGHRGWGANLPYCREDGCGRRAYLDDLCYVCDAALFNEWLPKLLRGSPARHQHTAAVANPAVAPAAAPAVADPTVAAPAVAAPAAAAQFDDAALPRVKAAPPNAAVAQQLPAVGIGTAANPPSPPPRRVPAVTPAVADPAVAAQAAAAPAPRGLKAGPPHILAAAAAAKAAAAAEEELARQSSAPLQDFMGNPALAGLCMGFLYGDGWGQQCHCTRCKRPWLNAGWVCPVEYQRRTYLQHLDRMFHLAGYTTPELCYVDWGAAVRQLHDMETDEIPLDPRVLVEFARASCRRVREELHEMYPGERFLDEPYPDDDIFDDVGEVHPDELDAVPPGAPRSRHAQQF